jgi:hypothetical protein
VAETPLGKQPEPGGVGKGGRQTPIDGNLMARVSAGLKWMFTGQRPPAEVTGQPVPNQASVPNPAGVPAVVANPNAPAMTPSPGMDVWMGPGAPMTPQTINPADVAGREMDYRVGYNITARPRQGEGVSFEALEGLYESLDLVKLCVETRKDQMGNLTWSCLPRQPVGTPPAKRKPDARCEQIETFFRKPDGRLAYAQWARELIHDQLVFDAPSIYVRRTLGGDVFALEVVKGSYIDVKLDATGRVPLYPAPAYQHVLKGLPAINYTTRDLIYWPRNLRAGHRYGFSPVEQLLMSLNIAIRREVEKLNFYTEGNIPEAMIGCPESWTPETIERWQAIWDATMADQTIRRRARFVPGKMSYTQTRSEDSIGQQGDEWWARVVCYAFSLPPLPFVKQQNRATAETAVEEALSEGLQPMMIWWKSLIDHIIQEVFGFSDLELVWDDVRKVDPEQQDQMDLSQIAVGRKSVDESRLARGEDPIGMTHAIWGIGPLGIMFVDDLLKAKEQGVLLQAFIAAGTPPAPPQIDPATGLPIPGAPPAASPMIGHNGGPPMDPRTGLHPDAAAALQGVSPKLLTAVGLGAAGAAGRTVDVTGHDAFQSDPLSAHAAHPQVLALLRQAERRQGRSRR